jgi:hypothetical protein
MTLEYIDLPGDSIDVDALEIPRARQIASAITGGRLDFVRLIECCKFAGASIEILVIEVEVERPQVVVNPIRRVERLAVLLSAVDDSYPEVLAVRKGFPIVPHLNITFDENTRSLCLYDQSWDEVKARWTAPAFIERIRRWLADTAIGSLHREDQPLEQVLAGSGYSIVIPSSAIKSGGEAATRLDVILIPSDEHRGTLIAIPMSAKGRPKKLQFTASMFFAGSRQHGIIQRAPRTLEELCEFVRTEEFDLLAELRKRVMGWKDDGCLEVSLIVVIAFPLQRGDVATVEVTDTWAFLTTENIYEVGKRIGVWERNEGEVGVFVPPIATLKGADVALEVVRPHFSFSKEAAARASGVDAVDAKTVAVGVGAIGSQIVLNLVRSGFGRWTVIDHDELLPHNLARHALFSNGIGWPKAVVLAATINSFFEDGPPAEAIATNVLRAGEAKKKLDTAFADADLILDFSASAPVSRHLARDVQSAARRASLFLNPRGSDLVCIREDAKRTMPLDGLEAQYYRAVIRAPALGGHLAMNEARTRYARSCRDVSFSIPTHLVSMHSAIAAQAVRTSYSSECASVRIWHADPLTCAVSIVDVPLFTSHRAQLGGWTVVIDQWLMDHLQELRAKRLPNETGGVLIGMYDMPRKTVYVVDTIHSPSDSKEKPTLYIRGCEGLEERMATINAETAGELEYIGEWHSHPDGCSCAPSNDDLNLFANITDRMTAAGYPAFMAIVGQHNQSAWFLGTMASDCGWSAPASAGVK